jgi:hypothetical protein
MIVMARSSPNRTCRRASHQPATTNQTTLAIVEPAPALSRRTTTRPKGQSVYPASRKAGTASGMVTINRRASTPATT